MGAFWHPFAFMGKVDGNEFIVDRGEGVYVYDKAGKKYLDGTASLWYNQVGYGRTEIADAVAAQITKLHAFHTFGDYSNEPAMDLANRISQIAPLPASKVFFTSGGSDSVDTAAKMARRYFAEIGERERTVLITRNWGYHGTHGYGTALAGMEANLEHYGRPVSDIVQVEWDSLDSLTAAIDDIGPERVAGLFAEPVIGAGGVRYAGDHYFKEARRIISDAGALFIADEVITGFGRVGAWFASERFSLEPDLITFAKGVTSGYVPLGGVVIAPRVADVLWSEDFMWRHGYTYSGHPTACVAGLVNLEIMEREDLVSRALVLENDLADALETLLDHPVVTEVRAGTGVLGGVQIDPERVAADHTIAGVAARHSRAAGVITRAIGGGGLQASPPLTISLSQLDELAAGLRAGLDAIA